MLELVKNLLLIIQAVAGYPAPDVLPAVNIVPDAELQRMACGGPCWVKAFYDPDRGIYLSESIDFYRDTYGRSILLHELVHYTQRVSGRFEPSASPCERRKVEELEAYHIQNQFLAMNLDPRTIPVRTLALRCD